MTSEYVAHAIRQLGDLPGVERDLERARDACTKLRFHEGLRRRWEEARAEAAVRNARDGAVLCGAKLSLTQLREMTVKTDRGPLLTPVQVFGRDGAQKAKIGGVNHGNHNVERQEITNLEDTNLGLPRLDPSIRQALAHWRVQLHVNALLPPLQGRKTGGKLPPWPQLLTGFSRDYYGNDVGLNQKVREESAEKRALVAEAAGAIAALEANGAPAALRAGIVVAELATREPLGAASHAVGFGLSRLLLTVEGVDPTGLVLSGALAANDLKIWRENLSVYTQATPNSMAAYLRFWLRMVAGGAQEATRLATAILARDTRAGR